MRAGVLALALAACSDTLIPPQPASLVPVDPSGAATVTATFPITRVADASSVMIELLNAGDLPTGAIADALAGNEPGAFAITDDTCSGTALDSRAHCAITLAFHPAARGTHAAELIAAAAPGGSTALALSGAATMGAFAIAPSTFAFPPTELGGIPETTFTLTNSGDALARLDDIVVTGPGFAVGSTTCGTSLDPGLACDVRVTFGPTAVGPITGQLAIRSEGIKYTAALSGTGSARLTIQLAGTGSGRVTSSPVAIECGATCDALFTGDVTLTATPGPSSVFTSWSIAGCTGPTCTVFANSLPATVTATFDAQSSASRSESAPL